MLLQACMELLLYKDVRHLCSMNFKSSHMHKQQVF